MTTTYIFKNYLGEFQTISVNDILSFHTDTVPRYTGRITKIDDENIHISWTGHYGKNVLALQEVFIPKMVNYHHITKTNNDDIVLHLSGIDTSTELSKKFIDQIELNINKDYGNINV